MVATSPEPHSLRQAAQKFRARAKECRILAAMTEEPSRSGFLEVARAYDRLALEYGSRSKTRSVSPATVAFYIPKGMVAVNVTRWLSRLVVKMSARGSLVGRSASTRRQHMRWLKNASEQVLVHPT
jgi:hypothetical protein